MSPPDHATTTPTHTVHPRVAIVGTGTIGTMAAWQLAAQGAEVIAFDQHAPPHDRGAAGGESRIFRTAYMEGAGYVPLLRRAEELWRTLEADSGRDLLDRCGAVSIGTPDHPAMREVVAGARDHGLDHEILTPHQAADRFPHHPLAPDEIAVVDPQAGVIRPEVALLAATHRAQQAGARLRTHTPVTHIEPRGAGWSVHEATGHRHDVDVVVLAPGPWSTSAHTPAPAVLQPLGLHTRQISLCWFPADRPHQRTPRHSPVVIRVGTIGYSCFPVLDGVSVKVSVHTAPRPTRTDPRQLPRDVAEDLAAAATAAVRTHLPGLHPHPSRTATFADVFTPDGHAALGWAPHHPGLLLATGFSGHGFKLAPLFGEVIADLTLRGHTRHDITHLDPARLLGDH